METVPQYRSDSAGLKNPQTSAELFGIDPSPYDGVGPVSFLVSILLICRFRIVRVFWPLTGRLREVRVSTLCSNLSRVSFQHFLKQFSLGIMKVKRFDFNIRV